MGRLFGIVSYSRPPPASVSTYCGVNALRRTFSVIVKSSRTYGQPSFEAIDPAGILHPFTTLNNYMKHNVQKLKSHMSIL